LTTSAAPADYSGVFGIDNGLSLTADLSSLSAEATGIVKYVRHSFGEPKIPVELDNKQIFTMFENANIEYAATINKYEATNRMTNILGLSRSAGNDLTNKLPHQTLDYLMRLANPFATEAGVGGVQNFRKAYVTVTNARTDYDMLNDFIDYDTELPVSAYVNSVNGAKISLRKVWHNNPSSINRYYDPFASNNFMAQEFQYESYNADTNFYIYPVYADMLRANAIETTDKVRRSNYSYWAQGSKLRILPVTPRDVKVWIEYTGDMDPFNPDFAISGGDPSVTGITGIHNVPVTDVSYDQLNSVAKHWIREMCLASCMVVLGRIRRKFSSIPIPNGEIQLDGDQLVSEGIEKQQMLREELKELMDKTSDLEMMRADSEMYEMVEQQMQKIPLPTPILLMS
ncbi:MAG: hypothetical protein O3C19_01910, partial [Bacteroidetes bacterium]|nr:hypothetical protein [Bacteroidota bacterium]